MIFHFPEGEGGGSGPPPDPPLDPHMQSQIRAPAQYLQFLGGCDGAIIYLSHYDLSTHAQYCSRPFYNFKRLKMYLEIDRK